jgi:hypothetical protein
VSPNPHSYKAAEDRPKFIAEDNKDKRWMFNWVCSRLDDWAEAYEWRGTHVDEAYEKALEEAYDAECANLDGDDYARANRAAESGDVKRLRAMFPQHERCINLPKLLRGLKWRKKKERDWLSFPKDHSDRVELAVAEGVIIREIWQQYYGKSNQAGGQAMRVETVAERWDVNPEGVRARLEHL